MFHAGTVTSPVVPRKRRFFSQPAVVLLILAGMNAERRPFSGDHELSKARRELRKKRRHRSEKMLLMMIVLGPMLIYAAYELGRSLMYMQHVMRFAKTIDTQSPADVKQAVARYANDLHSSNPLIRNGAIIAMKIATGWHLTSDTSEWTEMWAKQEPYWEYHRHTTNAPPAESDWRKLIPADVKPAPDNKP